MIKSHEKKISSLTTPHSRLMNRITERKRVRRNESLIVIKKPG